MKKKVAQKLEEAQRCRPAPPSEPGLDGRDGKKHQLKKVSRANFVIILILHVKLSNRYPIVRKKCTIFLYCLIVTILDETPHPVKF